MNMSKMKGFKPMAAGMSAGESMPMARGMAKQKSPVLARMKGKRSKRAHRLAKKIL